MNKRFKNVSLMLLLMGLPSVAAFAETQPVDNLRQAQGELLIVQQNGALTGVVVDAKGEPLVGASVLVKGTTKGSTTDNSGRFTINGVKNGATVHISYIGFVTQDVKWDGQPLRVVLAEDDANLSEVVVVGFGTQKKVNLTGAVNQVKMEDVLGDRPVTDAAAALQGAIPGLTLSGGSSVDGAKSMKIRGTLSINGGGPLVLIDNVEGDINMLNPEDIESVSVLKDASSAAIYGARAAGGVVLITTKHPKPDTKFKLNYNFNVGFDQRLTLLEQAPLLDFIHAYDEAGYTKTYWAGNGDITRWGELLQQYKDNPGSLATVGDGIFKEDSRVYWLSEKNLSQQIFETGVMNKHNLTASGGTDRLQYRIAAGYVHRDGPQLTDKDAFTRKNISTLISAQVTKWLKSEANLSYAVSDKNNPENVSGQFYTTRLLNYYPDGNIPAEILNADKDYPSQTPKNMLMMAPVSHNNRSVARISLREIVTLLPGWTVTGEYTFDRKDANYNYYTGSYKYADCQLAVKPSVEAGQDTYTKYDDITKYNAINVYTNYEHTWGKHELKVMGGFNQESSDYSRFYAQVKGQSVQSVPSFGGGTGEKTISDSYSQYSIRSGFGRINYAFANRYLVELSGRYDGSSKFPTDNRFGFFPSGSVGWRIDQEGFMKSTKNWLDELKIRASYGALGNQNISPYQFTPSMSLNTKGQSWIDGYNYVTTISTPGLVSSTFTWEKVNSFNLGLDFGAFRNRLNVNFDYFTRATHGMLAAGIEIPSVVGASAPLQNVADMKTKGWELNLRWRDRIGDWAYYVGFNIYDQLSEITKYNNESGLLSDYRVGQKLGEIWGYCADGYYSIDDFDLEAAKGGAWKLKEGVTSIQGVNVQPGDMKFKDLDGDGVITAGTNTVDDPGDRKILGNNIARYQFGGNFGVSWKGLALDVQFQGVGKRDYWLGGAAIFPFAGAGAGDAVFQPIYYNQTDYWTAKSYDPQSPNYMVAANPDAHLFRIYGQGNNVGSNTRTSDKYLTDASYMRIKNVTLSYTFDRQLIRKAYLTNAKVFVSVDNLATISHTPKGYDAEGNSSNSIGYSYPFYRTISFGVNLSF